MIDRVLAMVYRLMVTVLSDPPAFALLVAWFLACLIAIGVGWHYLCSACAAATRRRRSKPASPPAADADSKPADPQTRAQLDALELALHVIPTLRARIIRRARERAAIRRARTRI